MVWSFPHANVDKNVYDWRFLCGKNVKLCNLSGFRSVEKIIRKIEQNYFLLRSLCFFENRIPGENHCEQVSAEMCFQSSGIGIIMSSNSTP